MNQNKVNVAICTLDIGADFKKAVLPSQLSKKLYCKKHNYAYIDDESVYDKTRPIAWSKILLLQKYLPNYDYLVWIDADAMIMNLEQKLEDKIMLMNSKDIMVQKPFPRINTGVIFIKNTDYSLKFLKRLYEHTEFLDQEKYGDWE